MGRTVIESHEVVFDPDNDLRPVGDQVLIKGIKNEKTVGGIILPKGEKASSFVGEVVGVGNGFLSHRTGTLFQLAVRVGDYVVTMDYMGQHLDINGHKYRLVREHGIWAILEVRHREGGFEIDKVTPYNGHILVRPLVTEKSEGGIFLPSDPKVMYQRCEIVSVGHGYRDMESGEIHQVEVSVGEKAVMRRYAGSQLTVKREELRLIDRQDILFVMEEE